MQDSADERRLIRRCPHCDAVVAPSRFCPQCSTPLDAAGAAEGVQAPHRSALQVPGAAPPPGAVRGGEGGVKLEYNHWRVRVEGAATVLKFRLTNSTIEAIRNIQLECNAFGHTRRSSQRVLLRPHESSDMSLEFHPTCHGECHIGVVLSYFSEDRGDMRLAGEQDTWVLKRDQDHGSFGPGGTVMADISQLVGDNLTINIGQAERAKSYEELAALDLDPRYVVVALEERGECLSTGEYLDELWPGVPTSKALALVLGGVPCVERTYLILSEELVCLGRAREDLEELNRRNHIVTWVLRGTPEETKASSLAISRYHAQIRISAEGAQLRNVSPHPMATRLDGSDVAPGQCAPMDGEGKISLSSALELEYRVFEHERDCGTAGMVSRTGALLEYEGLGRIASVLLRRLNNANDEEYVLLAKCASVGSSRDCAVCVPDGSIAGVHARIIRHKSRYWIVSKDLNTRLERDGTSRRLSTRTAYAIRTGDRILLGHRAFLDVREYAQRDVNEPDS